MLYSFLNIIFNLLTVITYIIKVYRIIFLLKIITDHLPKLDITEWPFSIFYILTAPLSKFFNNYIPKLAIGPIDLDIELIIALDIFESILEFIDNLKLYILELL